MKLIHRVSISCLILIMLASAEVFASSTRVEYLTRDGNQGAVASRSDVPSHAWVTRVVEIREKDGRPQEATTFEWERPETPCGLFTLYGSDFLSALLLAQMQGVDLSDFERCYIDEAPGVGIAIERACRAGRIRNKADFLIELMEATTKEMRGCEARLSDREKEAIMRLSDPAYQEAIRQELQTDPEAAHLGWLDVIEPPGLPKPRSHADIPAFSAPEIRVDE